VTLWYVYAVVASGGKLKFGTRVYAVISLYLLICSFWLAGTAFANIPNLLKNKTQAEVIASFFKPPIGALIAAAISTFGIYLIASFLYVRDSIKNSRSGKLNWDRSVIHGTWDRVSCNTFSWLPASQTFSMSMRSVTCMM
jgi:hypothetical protein